MVTSTAAGVGSLHAALAFLLKSRVLNHPVPQSMPTSSRVPLWFSHVNVTTDHIQVVAGSFEGLFGVMVRDESGVIIQSHVPLPPETVEDNQEASVFLVNA